VRVPLRLPNLSLRFPEITKPRLLTLAYVTLAVVVTAPAWIVKHPPMMDLPFHLATIRIIHSLHDPAFGLDRDFVLTLGRTQYVLYYLVGSLLAYPLGVVKANVVLMSAYLGGTVLALRALLSALGRDERLCLFAMPLVVNAMFMFGLFPFLVGIPLMFLALAAAVRYFEAPTRGRGIGLCLLMMALFYSHIFPFALFCLGFAALFPWTKPRQWIVAAAPAVPALLTLGAWTLFTEAGRLTRGALTDSSHDPRRPVDQAIGDVHNWLTNVFVDTSDDVIFAVFIALIVLTIGLSMGDRMEAKPATRAYVLLPILCIVFYFTSAEAHGYIWLIAQRFPVLFLLTTIPILPFPTGRRGWAVAAAVVAVGVVSIVNTCKHFIEFELTEVGDIDRAIASMEPGKKVCALIYDRGSRIIGGQWAPFLHFGSYYQVEKGGVVMFTYAGYAHWPVDFRPDHYPPPGGSARLRWEWTPESISLEREILPYYDYVLTRGYGFHPPPGTFHVGFSSDKWTVWASDRRLPGQASQ
jgi:hypothetical protein